MKKALLNILQYSIIVVITGLYFSIIWGNVFANPEIAVLQSALVWRADDKGDYVFKGNGKLEGAIIAQDGAIEGSSSAGSYELSSAYKTAGMISTVAVNWSFEGKVTMELSAGKGYVKVINGTPLGWGEFLAGDEIKWKATLTKGSKLKEVNIVYTDISGARGNWGAPELSGFKFRKPVYLKGSESAELFNYQFPVTIGESTDVLGCDVYIKGVIQSDFSDVRWTQADKQTLLPVWRESLSGKTGRRKAVYWINVPQLPKEGLPVYLYYGKGNAADLSDGKTVFDLFEDFTSAGFAGLDREKWIKYDFSAAQIDYKLRTGGEIKTLDKDKMTNEQIADFFIEENKYDWVRARQYIQPQPAADKAKTGQASEELPNLPDFAGTRVAENGDLVLAEKSNQGRYSSMVFDSELPARIMVASWKEQTSGNNALKINISAAEQGKGPKTECAKDTYYYASREDFTAGQTVKWEAGLSRKYNTADSPLLSEFSIDYRPGTITLVSPDGGEDLAAGSEYKIVWSAWEYEPSYKMKLEYSPDGGKTYNLITQEAVNSGKYLWTVADKLSDQATVRISDALDNSIFDISRGYFTITAGAEGTILNNIYFKNSTVPLPSAEQSSAAAVSGSQIANTQAQDSAPPAVLSSRTVNIELDKVVSINERSGAALYDLVFKIDDPVEIKGNTQGDYEGELVVIIPAGNNWSETEKNSFLIIPVYLTEKEAAEFNQRQEVLTGRKDNFGNPLRELAKKRYKINLQKLGLHRGMEKIERGKKNIDEINRLLQEKHPDKEAIE